VVRGNDVCEEEAAAVAAAGPASDGRAVDRAVVVGLAGEPCMPAWR